MHLKFKKLNINLCLCASSSVILKICLKFILRHFFHKAKQNETMTTLEVFSRILNSQFILPNNVILKSFEAIFKELFNKHIVSEIFEE